MPLIFAHIIRTLNLLFMKYLSLVFLLVAGLMANAQDLKLPSLSPNAKITQSFSTSEIEISYSRPSARNRQVFGTVVPYGQVWRTGANGATKVKFGEDVVINGKSIKAGEYALYTIPNKTQWEIIFNKGVGNWGASGYSTADDIARFSVQPKTINNKIETFTINISNITFNTCNIELTWENTKVVIPVKADNEERISKSITKAIKEPTIPYYRAASYYYETGQHLDEALSFVDKAVEQNPKAFYMWYLKARIAQKMGKNDIAIDAANQAIESSKGSAYEDEYKRNNQKIIDALKKK
jgi:hypothetical protein